MTTIIRRYPRRRRGRAAAATIMATVAIVALSMVLVMAWNRGGPQPLREIAVSLPAPAMPVGSSQ